MDEPLHRQWLHALEDDKTVPDYAMQVARVFADFASSAGERGVRVSWPMLQRTTHQHNSKVSKSVVWLRENGWLAELPSKDGIPAKTGARKLYTLTTPNGRSALNGQSAPKGQTTPNGQNVTSPNGQSGSTPNGRSTNVKRQRTSSLSSLDLAKQRLSGLGATEREIDAVIDKFKRSGKVYAVGKYLLSILDSGDALDHIADVRRQLVDEDRMASRSSEAHTPGDWPLGRPHSWPPHCEDQWCDPRTSQREEPGTGVPTGRCPQCHPQAARRSA